MKTALFAYLSAVFICGLSRAEDLKMPVVPSITRKDLLTAMISPEKCFSKVEIKEVTMGPKQSAPLHLHPCPVVGVVVEGIITFQIEGQMVQHLKSGDAFFEPANVRVACFNNDGDVPARFLAFYLLGKDENELVRMLNK